MYSKSMHTSTRDYNKLFYIFSNKPFKLKTLLNTVLFSQLLMQHTQYTTDVCVSVCECVCVLFSCIGGWCAYEI